MPLNSLFGFFTGSGGAGLAENNLGGIGQGQAGANALQQTVVTHVDTDSRTITVDYPSVAIGIQEQQQRYVQAAQEQMQQAYQNISYQMNTYNDITAYRLTRSPDVLEELHTFAKAFSSNGLEFTEIVVPKQTYAKLKIYMDNMIRYNYPDHVPGRQDIVFNTSMGSVKFVCEGEQKIDFSKYMEDIE